MLLKLLKLLKFVLVPLLFGFIGYVLNPYIGNIFTGPIKVSPALIKLKTTIEIPPEVIRRHPFLKDSGAKMVEWGFSLINKTSENFYDVWVKLTPVCPDMDLSGLCSRVEIEPLSLDPRYTVPLKTKYSCGNIIRLDGIGENRLTNIWLCLYALEAHEKKCFVLRLPESIISHDQHESEIRLKTYGRLFEKGPSKIAPPFSHKETQPGKGYFTWNFQAPEDIKRARISSVYARMKPRNKKGLEELTDLLSETKQHLEENEQEILASLERIYKRISEGQELPRETILKKAEKKFAMVRNYNANFLLGEGYEEKGCIGMWFAPLWDGKNTQKFFLADLVGRLDKDRISLFIDKDDLVYQVLTSDGRRETIAIDNTSWKKGRPRLILAQWDTNKNWMSLFAGEKDLPSPAQVKEKTVQHLHFDKLGPLVFMSIDFEGKYPAKLKPGSLLEVYSIEEQLKRGGWKEYKE